MEPVVGVGRVGILFALPEESRGLRAVLAGSRLNLGTCDGLEFARIGELEVVIAQSGIGRDSCREAAHRLVGEGTEWIVSAGFAAGLDPDVRAGEVLVSEHVGLMGGQESDPIPGSREILSALPPRSAFGFPVRMCDTITSDKLILTALEKNAVRRQTGAVGLDMESYAAAELCRERETPFLAIRGVSDSAEQDLPGVVADLAGVEGGLRRAYACAMRPSQWLSLWRLGKQAAVASTNLGDFLGLLLLRLVRTGRSTG